MIRRPPISTPLYSSAASDVYKRQADAVHDHLAFGAAPRAHLPHALLELQVGGDEHTVGVLKPRQQVVASFVPAGRRLLERLVVRLLRVLDDPLEANVAANLVPSSVEPVSYTHLRAHETDSY